MLFNTSFNMSSNKRVSKHAGFTLIELMIAVLVVAVLAAVAIPGYYSYVERSRRSDAVTTLMSLAQAQERFMAIHGSYAALLSGSVADGEGLGVPADNTSNEGFYSMSLDRPRDGAYILTATPRASQASDIECAAFTLSHTGQKEVTGTGSIDDCW